MVVHRAYPPALRAASRFVDAPGRRAVVRRNATRPRGAPGQHAATWDSSTFEVDVPEADLSCAGRVAGSRATLKGQDVGDTSSLRTSASRSAPSASARRPQPPLLPRRGGPKRRNAVWGGPMRGTRCWVRFLGPAVRGACRCGSEDSDPSPEEGRAGWEGRGVGCASLVPLFEGPAGVAVRYSDPAPEEGRAGEDAGGTGGGECRDLHVGGA